jgi:hypothetical protein
MNTFSRVLTILFLVSIGTTSLHAQGSLMRRIQEKAEQKVVDEIFKDTEKNETPQNRIENEETPSGQRRRGGGLNQEKPDVAKSIQEANAAFSANKYTEAKNAVKRALWGVELEIGQNILNTLPVAVQDLQYENTQDRVSSSGIGFMGLIIERNYRNSNDVELQTTIGNDSAILGLSGFYLNEGMYIQSTDQTNQKQIQFKDHKAVIRFEEYEGYTLSVPLGQTSIFVAKGINFDTENQFMTAVNNFDINTIKKELGEK